MKVSVITKTPIVGFGAEWESVSVDVVDIVADTFHQAAMMVLTGKSCSIAKDAPDSIMVVSRPTGQVDLVATWDKKQTIISAIPFNG